MNKKTSLDDIVRENIKKIMKAKELRSIDIIRKINKVIIESKNV